MDKKQEEISKTILNYLRKNPDAGDTLEGISKWWFNLERIETSVDEVACIVEMLIDKGLIKKVKHNNSSLNYYVSNNVK